MAPTTRTVYFTAPSVEDVLRRCRESYPALTSVAWELDDALQLATNAVVVDVEQIQRWRTVLRNAQLALALVACLEVRS